MFYLFSSNRKGAFAFYEYLSRSCEAGAEKRFALHSGLIKSQDKRQEFLIDTSLAAGQGTLVDP